MNKRKIIEWYKQSIIYSFFEKIINKYFRIKLKNNNMTILCPNCIGGVIYHRLGLPFLSPTINMWLNQPDFLQFVLNIDGYLEESLTFIEGLDDTPVARLGNGKELPFITLHFNHAHSSVEAEIQWERRKTRINKNNLYIILYNLDGITVDQLHQLDDYPCNNKVVLTSVPLPEIRWSYYIKVNPKSQYPSSYLGKDVFSLRDYEKKFDFVSFLNKK